jgi:hypothetical protein
MASPETGADRAVTSGQQRATSKARSRQDRAARKAKSWKRQPVSRYE